MVLDVDVHDIVVAVGPSSVEVVLQGGVRTVTRYGEEHVVDAIGTEGLEAHLVAEIATQQLALHFADRLPYGAVVPQTLDDGGIRIDAWYSSTPMTQ